MLAPGETKNPKYKWALIGVFSVVFFGLYIFFRYVHPVAPWDGDDWAALGPFLVQSKTPYPVIGNRESERMFCSLSGTFFGYLAAFVVYPLLGDYVLSIVTVNAIVLALAITVSLIGVYYIAKRIARGRFGAIMLGLGLYVLFAFICLKTREGSAYLYWQYNLCTIYYYSVPSYLAGTFGIYLIINEVYQRGNWDPSLKTALLTGVWYVLNFSFLPAALLLAAISLMILLLRYIEQRNLKSLFTKGWFYWMVLAGFAAKVFFEMIKNFGNGYLTIEGSILQRITASFHCMIKIFSEMHPLFCIAMVFFVVSAIWIRARKGAEAEETDIVFVILAGAFVMMFIFFVLFGAISLNHLYREIPRLDTLYVLYFLMILIGVLSAIYVLNNNKRIIVGVPLFMVLMLSIVISPRNSYSDSCYSDSTPAQRYEIMKTIVEEAQRRDIVGNSGFIVHMPTVGHYCYGLSETLYYHNITSRVIPITFSYEDRSDVCFEDYIP